MRYTGSKREMGRALERAAIYVDYENIYDLLSRRSGNRERPEHIIHDLIDAVRGMVNEELRIKSISLNAYADFSGLRGNGQQIQRALYMLGVEAKFVPAVLQDNASEIQLCLDAAGEMLGDPDLSILVVISGDRPYLPLVQHFRQHHPRGRALVVAVEPPSQLGAIPFIEDDIYLSASELLHGGDRPRSSRGGGRSRNGHPSPDDAPAPERQPPSHQHPVESEGAQLALEVIEEHFGQYDEVYLTPLLRKLSELLDESIYDPKSLISELEEAGAVWLEKRKGFPYDYTVLLVNYDHTDVQDVQQQFEGSTGYVDDDSLDEYDDEYDDDTYEEDFYTDDYDDDEPYDDSVDGEGYGEDVPSDEEAEERA